VNLPATNQDTLEYKLLRTLLDDKDAWEMVTFSDEDEARFLLCVPQKR